MTAGPTPRGRGPFCTRPTSRASVGAIQGSIPSTRGTFLGLASPAVLDHLLGLGVTAVELLPVQQFLTEQRLLDLGLRNYWGYSTLGFFAPHAGYRVGSVPASQVVQFKEMVKTLHRSGLEVILDVVYNHTAEGEAHEPPIAFRGLANEKYYRLDPDDPCRYVDSTGTGNALNVDRPEVLRLIMDSLRYWVTEMHVDGFRFDLATTLARDSGSFDRLAAFFDLVYQDPVINRVKLIAEPWDVNRPDSYQAGRFPRGWAEWNDRYRDDVRDFWRRRGSVARHGVSADRVQRPVRRRSARPGTSINYVTSHDGKTLRDLVTYERKHNEANGENNNDGSADDRADNFGVEGRTRDERVLGVRARRQRNLIATLPLSQGVPMILGGDECCRTQRGNSNAYCQDNEISWYDWSAKCGQFTEFTRHLIFLNGAYPVIRRPWFLTGSGDSPDIAWFDAAGRSMTEDAWNDPSNLFVAYLLYGRTAEFPAGDVLVVLNAGPAQPEFVVPGVPGQRFTFLVDTRTADGRPPAEVVTSTGSTVVIPADTVLVASAPHPGPAIPPQTSTSSAVPDRATRCPSRRPVTDHGTKRKYRLVQGDSPYTERTLVLHRHHARRAKEHFPRGDSAARTGGQRRTPQPTSRAPSQDRSVISHPSRNCTPKPPRG